MVTDGLQLYYDVNNTKSYPGEPTTNLINYPDFRNGATTGWVSNQLATLEATTHDGKDCMKVTSTTATSTPGTKKNPTISVSPNTTYRISQWGKNGPSGLMRWYIAGEVSGQLLWTTCGHNSSDWTRQTTTFTTGASDTYITLYYLWSGVAVGYYWYLTDVQLEVDKGYVTQFVNGTRSSTDGLKDLSGQGNHADLDNTTYNSSALIDYNGSSAYSLVSSDGFGTFNNQSFTIEAWIYPHQNTGDGVIFSYDYTGHAGTYYAAQLRQTSTGYIYFAWNNGTTYQDAGYNGVECIPAINEWYCIQCVYTSGRQEVWVNGVLKQSTTNTDIITFYNQEVWIGRGNWGGYFDGKIDVVKYYNRALSGNEILQNFNALKGRYI